MQVTPGTGRALARQLGVHCFSNDMLRHAEYNAHLGMKYLAQQFCRLRWPTAGRLRRLQRRAPAHHALARLPRIRRRRAVRRTHPVRRDTRLRQDRAGQRAHLPRALRRRAGQRERRRLIATRREVGVVPTSLRSRGPRLACIPFSTLLTSACGQPAASPGAESGTSETAGNGDAGRDANRAIRRPPPTRPASRAAAHPTAPARDPALVGTPCSATACTGFTSGPEVPCRV